MKNEPVLNEMQLTHEVFSTTQYYKDGPQQMRPPDGTFKEGTKVSVSDGQNFSNSYVDVTSEEGISGYVLTSALRPISSNDSSDLYDLNEKINYYEINRGDEAAQFFIQTLHNDLYFKRSDDTMIRKEDFIKNLEKPDPFDKRIIENIIVQPLDTNYAIVTCIVVGKKINEQNVHRYRNIRIFKNVEGKWLLHYWYNYEIDSK